MIRAAQVSVLLRPRMSLARRLWALRPLAVPVSIFVWWALGGAAAPLVIVLGLAVYLGVSVLGGARAELEGVEIDVRGAELVLRAAFEQRVVPRSLVTGGYVVPLAAGVARLVLFAGNEVVVRATLADVDEARRALDALGLSALERPITLSFRGGLRVTVGVDGVVVAWPLLRKRRFVPHARIDDVLHTTERVTLVLTDGERYEIETNAGEADAREAHDALVERLLSARTAYRAAERADAVAALARGGRTADAWVRELGALGRGGGDRYRSASVPVEALWRVALDPAASEEHRIGAGLALRGTLDDDGRSRLRVVAGSSASPRVRVALTAAVDAEDDAAVVQALEARPRDD